MKLRIAAIIAVVVLVAAIAAYWWPFTDSSTSGSQPSVVEVPPQPSQAEAPNQRGPDSVPTPPGVRSGLPPTPGTPATAASPVRPAGKPQPTPAPKGSTPPVPAPAIPAAIAATMTTPPSIPDPSVTAKAVIELDKVGLMFRDYRTRMGENPTGTNAEIMRAVMGGNPKQAMLGPPEGQQLNGDGELVDRWGTAYFFHQMSKTDMEIRSAGPDRQMGTDDDIIGR